MSENVDSMLMLLKGFTFDGDTGRTISDFYTAVSGQTAALNSYCKLPLGDMANGASLDIAIGNRSSVLSQLEVLIKSFIEKRGNHLSVAVNDCEKMRAAQTEPEKHRDLIIRVGGWQAFFTDLPRAMQAWQIKKCEQYAGA